MFKLALDLFSSDLSVSHPFLNDIIARASLILNHDRFQPTVLDKLCSQLVTIRSSDCEELKNFVHTGCSQLKIEVCVDKFNVPNVLMQCVPVPHNETKPCQILISQCWYKEIRHVNPTDDEYKLHVVLGSIKLIHEVCHCCTNVFCAFSSLVNEGKKPIKITPQNIGRKIVRTSPTSKASPSKRKRGTLTTKRTKKSTKEIGDMGFGGEELLLGGRLFPILDNLTEREFKITNLRLDFHKQSSIASSKCVFDVNLIKNLFDLDQLKNLSDLSSLKTRFNHAVDGSPKKDGGVFHTRPIRAKRRKLKRAESDFSLSSSDSASSNAIDSSCLFNVDPNDPHVLYPPFYIPPPGFVPRSPNSSISLDEEPCRVNGMEPNYRE